MSNEILRFETPEDGIAVLTLQRPERLNALNGPLLDALAEAVRRIAADDAIRVFLLRGAARADGRPCFSAGRRPEGVCGGSRSRHRPGIRLTQAIDDLPKPSIAVIDGICTTGAAEIAVACHLRIVGTAARISDWHLRNLGTGWARGRGDALGAAGRQRARAGIVLDGTRDRRRGGGAHRLRERGAPVRAAVRRGARDGARDRGDGFARRGLTLAHFRGCDDWSREESLRFAQRAPRWYGISVDVAEKRAKVLGKS
jgi:hypothetical protein